MFSRPKILFLVSLLFVALLNSIPTYLSNFKFFYHYITCYKCDVDIYLLVVRPVWVTRPSSQSVDLTQTATFTCSATGYNVSYQWTIGSGSFPNKVTGRNTSNLTVTDVRSSDDNTYTCVVSNRGGTRRNDGRLTVTGMTMMIV